MESRCTSRAYRAVPRGIPLKKLSLPCIPFLENSLKTSRMTPLPPKRKIGSRTSDKVTLKTIAEHLGLTAGTVSAALNNSPAARSIPEHTKNRIIAAAHELNYQLIFFPRTLRLKRTYTIGVIAEEMGDAYGAMVISGIEKYLRKNNFFFLTVIHRHDPKLLRTYAQMLLTREYVPEIAIEPEFVARASTAAVPLRKVTEESRDMSQAAREQAGQPALQNLQD